MDWWNYNTEQYDRRAGPPLTDKAAAQHIPKGPARNLYLCHRELGLSTLEAMMKALSAVMGEAKDESN